MADVTPPLYDTCRVERRWLVRRGTLNPTTGGYQETEQEWKVGPCGHPLYGSGWRATGICPSCRIGWTHQDNHLTAAGQAILDEVKKEG